jgi:hypothetical protein
MVGINLAILATGNMHAHRSHPPWVGVTSWVFAVAGYALIGIGIVAIRRWHRRRRLGAHS